MRIGGSPRPGIAVIVLAATAAMLSGCVTAPRHRGPVTAPHSGPTPARVMTPLRPAPVAGALCQETGILTGLAVQRITPPKRFALSPFRHFAFPATVTVAGGGHAQRVARALCTLPRDTEVNCPADFALTYRLQFYDARFRIGPVLIEATGCEYVTGIGPFPRRVGPRFWSILGAAMGLAKPGVSVVSVFVPSVPAPAG